MRVEDAIDLSDLWQDFDRFDFLEDFDDHFEAPTPFCSPFFPPFQPFTIFCPISSPFHSITLPVIGSIV